MKKILFGILGCLAIAGLSTACLAQYAHAPKPFGDFSPQRTVVVINKDNKASVELGAYYANARGIPERNIVRVNIPGSPVEVTPSAFDKLKTEINHQMNDSITTVVFAWTAPYRVGCNSITSAYTFGYQEEICKKSCEPSKASPYFDSASNNPLHDYGMRLSMLLPILPDGSSNKLVDRGVAADRSWPAGEAYFLVTSDKARSSRSPFFPPSSELKYPPLKLHKFFTDSIKDKGDIMFYFTGLVTVPHLETLTFLPGAIADHLTSSGGDLLGKWQMSSLRWLEAGATGSYGSVSEPCNHWQKFPNPKVLLKHYLAGETLIEAYWKSVAWPGQGVFIGEALAAPYRAWLR